MVMEDELKVKEVKEVHFKPEVEELGSESGIDLDESLASMADEVPTDDEVDDVLRGSVEVLSTSNGSSSPRQSDEERSSLQRTGVGGNGSSGRRKGKK